MSQKKILVVDDEEMLVEFIRTRLEVNDFVVETASDGMEGLLKVAQMNPDLIILDVYMKPMDGYTMLKELRKNETMKDTPVIMLTASGKKKEIFEAEGISDYIMKPFDSDDFIVRVKKVLEGK